MRDVRYLLPSPMPSISSTISGGQLQQNLNKHPLLAGFEPARGNPNGFLVHRLNHSATTTTDAAISVLVCPPARVNIYTGRLSVEETPNHTNVEMLKGQEGRH